MYIYRNVALSIRDRIISGEYPPGQKLPSLHELTREFGVSTISIRRALKELTSEGLIYGEQGRGAFVKSKGIIHRVLPADPANSEGDAIAKSGFSPRIVEVGWDRTAATEDVAARLRMKSGRILQRHQKMIYADADPVSFHTLYFQPSLASKLRKKLASTFIYQLLHEAGFTVARTRFEFGAAALTSDHVEMFNLPVGFSMGIAHFTPLSEDGSPILTGTTIYRSDRFLYEISSSAPTID